MNRAIAVPIVLVAAAALGIGYWWGDRSASRATPAAAAGSGVQKASGEPGKILYYRHPMGLPDTSPVPKKDSMGMDYVPVYEGDAPVGPGFVIPSDKLQRLGVRTTEAGPRTLSRTVRAVGTVEVDERRLATVSPKFEGYVTRLYVATTGAPIRRGEPLLEVYSPDLVSAQEEYLVAQRNLTSLGDAGPEVRTRLERLVDASRVRLRNWDIDTADLAALERGRATRNVLLRSPVDGIVIEKTAVAGRRFMAGEALYQVANLDTVWLMANVFEQDLGALAPGQPAKATFAAYPGRIFEGRVAFVYPTLAAETRTLAVRVELPNRDQALKPGLYGTVEITAPPVQAKVAVPDGAILDSGTRKVVFAAYEGGRFEVKDVVLGARGDGFVAVLQGLDAGQAVVVDGNFLIDAESNLSAGAAAFGHSHGSAPAAGTAGEPAAAPAQGEMPGMPPSDAPAPAPKAHSGHPGR
jgi:membrane fusion protein, copper/silver efflux system